MAELGRQEYIRDRIKARRIASEPSPSGQMSLPLDDVTVPPLVPGTTLLSPEQRAINDRGLSMVRGILGRRGSFDQGTSERSVPPCMGCQ